MTFAAKDGRCGRGAVRRASAAKGSLKESSRAGSTPSGERVGTVRGGTRVDPSRIIA
jgi:hypothetical protein